MKCWKAAGAQGESGDRGGHPHRKGARVPQGLLVILAVTEVISKIVWRSPVKVPASPQRRAGRSDQ